MKISSSFLLLSALTPLLLVLLADFVFGRVSLPGYLFVLILFVYYGGQFPPGLAVLAHLGQLVLAVGGLLGGSGTVGVMGVKEGPESQLDIASGAFYLLAAFALKLTLFLIVQPPLLFFFFVSEYLNKQPFHFVQNAHPEYR